MKSILLFCILLAENFASGVVVRSPSGLVEVNFEVQAGRPFYRVGFAKTPLLDESSLGLTLTYPEPFTAFFLKASSNRHVKQNYVLPFARTRNIRDHFNEARFELEEITSPHRRLDVTFRLFDDGIAFRYTMPEQPQLKGFAIGEELTTFSLEGSPKIYALPLNFGSSYEGYYKIGLVTEFKPGATLGLPLLMEYPSGIWVGLTEARLTDYAGMYVAPSSRSLEVRLAPRLDDTRVKVRGFAPHASPWRVLLIGRRPGALLESPIIYNLNDPSVLDNIDWIVPGKVQFPWWNGYVMPDAAPGDRPGVNTWTYKRYIDFCADQGIAYHSIDGLDEAWYGGPIDPYEGHDVRRAIAAINLPEVLLYARAKKVKTRLWLNWKALWSERDLDAILATYEQWGISGIMVDFLNRDDQEAVQFYHRVLRATAKHNLTVSFHGVFKPTGLNRTFPHLLNHEAVLGSEYNKWSATGSTPEHEVYSTYIRMMAGHLDGHQGSFRPVSVEKFRPTNLAPQAMGTMARQIAMYVVHDNQLPMLVDYPAAYLAQREALRFVKDVPVSWNESHMVDGQVGKYITMARRNAKNWYLGAISDRQSRVLKIPLKFLGPGSFRMEIFRDASDHPQHFTRHLRIVTARDVLKVTLQPAGGFASSFRPLTERSLVGAGRHAGSNLARH